jgi:small subunit ribosomal protein S6
VGALDRITRIVSQSGGQVGKIDRWGRRRLAFELDKHTEGYYVVAGFTADPGVIKELERTLQLADEVIRSKVVVRGEAA